MPISYSDSDQTVISSINESTAVIPAKVFSIGPKSLTSSVTSLSFERGSNLTELSKESFASSNVLRVDLSNCLKLETLSYWCFYRCYSLESCLLPMNGILKSLGCGSFSRCSKLVSIIIPDTVEFFADDDPNQIDTGEFDTCSILKNVIVSSKSRLRILGRYSFVRCYKLESLRLPETLREIRSKCFHSCDNIYRVYIYSKDFTIDSESYLDVIMSFAVASSYSMNILLDFGISPYKIFLRDEIDCGTVKDLRSLSLLPCVIVAVFLK